MIINPSKLTGEISAIPSKSYAHRALICGGLARGKSKIYFDRTSKDIEATIDCLKELGADILKFDGGVEVSGIEKKDGVPYINPGESGSTFRFILPLATFFYDRCRFTGEGRLPYRPIKDLLDLMKDHGVSFSADKLPFVSKGKIKAGDYMIRGDVSSQYITGLLFLAPLFDEACKIILTSKLESKSYVDISLDVMEKFGIKVEEEIYGYEVSGQTYSPCDYKVEGDWSNAAFFLAAGALDNEITLRGLNTNSKQGDMKIVDVLKNYGADVRVTEDSVRVRSDKRRHIDVNLEDVPDMLPALSILAAGAKGRSSFYNGKRLRLKESDRLSTTAEMIRALGGQVEEREDCLVIYGKGGLRGGVVDSHNDHRIVMAASLASVISDDKIYLTGERAVEKSYPEFFKDFKKLGGSLE